MTFADLEIMAETPGEYNGMWVTTIGGNIVVTGKLEDIGALAREVKATLIMVGTPMLMVSTINKEYVVIGLKPNSNAVRLQKATIQQLTSFCKKKYSYRIDYNSNTHTYKLTVVAVPTGFTKVYHEEILENAIYKCLNDTELL